MKNKLEKIIKSIEEEIKKPDAYPYLPEILEILSLMRVSIVNKETAKEKKSKLIGGLIRLVTEDFEFSEGSLGTEILEVANQYYEPL